MNQPCEVCGSTDQSPRYMDPILCGPCYNNRQDKGLTFVGFWDAHAQWSRKAFGSDDRGPIGPLHHLEMEAIEAREETDEERRKVEIIDCFLLIVDAARTAGIKEDEFFKLAFAKLAINWGRKWERTSEDGVFEHLR